MTSIDLRRAEASSVPAMVRLALSFLLSLGFSGFVQAQPECSVSWAGIELNGPEQNLLIAHPPLQVPCCGIPFPSLCFYLEDVSNGAQIPIVSIQAGTLLPGPISSFPLPRVIPPGTYDIRFLPVGWIGCSGSFGGYTLGSGNENVFGRGDVNGDSQVALLDCILILQRLFFSIPLACPAAADFNDDTSLDLLDAVQFLSYLFLDGPEPSPPFEFCALVSDPAAALGDCFSGCP